MNESKLAFFVNYESKSVSDCANDSHEILKWINKGYTMVDFDSYIRCRDKFHKLKAARARKTELQRNRRKGIK